jgi:peptide chain release factor 1
MEKKQKLLSVTAADCRWDYYRGSGKGGQKKNKTSNCVRCTHIASGASAYSEDGRKQHHNKREAFKKMVNTEKFKKWLRFESMKRAGILQEREEYVEKELKYNIKIEVKKDGRWAKEENTLP